MLLVYENALQFGKRPFHICNSRQLPIDTSALKFYEPKSFEDKMLRETSARQPSGASISRTQHFAEKDDAKISESLRIYGGVTMRITKTYYFMKYDEQLDKIFQNL